MSFHLGCVMTQQGSVGIWQGPERLIGNGEKSSACFPLTVSLDKYLYSRGLGLLICKQQEDDWGLEGVQGPTQEVPKVRPSITLLGASVNKLSPWAFICHLSL